MWHLIKLDVVTSATKQLWVLCSLDDVTEQGNQYSQVQRDHCVRLVRSGNKGLHKEEIVRCY